MNSPTARTSPKNTLGFRFIPECDLWKRYALPRRMQAQLVTVRLTDYVLWVRREPAKMDVSRPTYGRQYSWGYLVPGILLAKEHGMYFDDKPNFYAAGSDSVSYG